MKKYIVYQHTNKYNGKSYVGITCQQENRRFRNGTGYEKCTYFYKAINKYGWESFNTDILFDGIDFETACKLEILLIKTLETSDKNKGYNTMLGGQNTEGMPEYVREKLRIANTGKKHSQETLNKMSKSHKGLLMGESNPMFGKGKCGSENPMYGMTGGKCPCSKEVIGDGLHFKCVQECADYFGIGYSSMRAYLNGQRKKPQVIIESHVRYKGVPNNGQAIQNS